MGKKDSNKSSAFYIKGKFHKNKNTNQPFKKRPCQNNHQNGSTSQVIICHYCHKKGHKSPECRKKKQDHNQHSQLNTAASEEPLHLFIAMDTNTGAKWYLDFGARQHMSPLKNLFRTYSILANPKPIYLADNTIHHAIGIGLVLFQLQSNQPLLINEILYVSRLA